MMRDRAGHPRRSTPGFTILELIVAVSLTMVVFAITLPFVRVQTQALGENAGRVESEQIARYAQRVIDKELRLASSDPDQPLLVYAGPMGISFNANLLAPDTTDPNALEIETGGLTSLTEAWRIADAATIPLTTRTYPPENYTDASGALSRIETISYFLHADTISDRSDIYVLFRKVNARDSVPLVRGIHVPADSAFFTYQRMVSGALATIPTTELPMDWDSAGISDIRAVGLRSAGFFRNRQTNEDVIRTEYWSVFLTNRRTAGRDCGAAPTPPANSDVDVYSNSKPFRVEIDWDDSPDDASGAGDVVYYLIDRKRSTASVWTTIGTVPATRSTTYQWSHMNPADTGSFDYGIRAVDCGGAVSSRETDNTVALP